MASPSTDIAAPGRTEAALAQLLLDTARTESHNAATALLRAAQLDQAARPHAKCGVPWGVLRFVAYSVADPSDIPTADVSILDDVEHDADATPQARALALVTHASEEVERAMFALATAAFALEEATRAGSAPRPRADRLWFLARALQGQMGWSTFGPVWTCARESIARVVRDHHSGESEAR